MQQTKSKRGPEVKDGDGVTDKGSANINANLLPNQPPYFTALWVDSTIDWAEGQNGEAGWEYWCLRFVANAFNLVENPPVPGLSGWVTAWDAANALERYDQGENGWLNAPQEVPSYSLVNRFTTADMLVSISVMET